MTTSRSRLQLLICGMAVVASWPTLAAQDVAATLERHGIQEAPRAVRDSAGWHPPRKVLLLQYGLREMDVAAFRTAAGGATVVAATNPASALREAADADVIIGHNPDICDARMIDAARELRWLASLSAGVELCMAVPQVKDSETLLMTNMRGVDSPVIAEHAISLLLALAHGLDVFFADNARHVWSRATTPDVQYLEGKTLLVSGLGGIGTEVARRAHGLGMNVIATRVGGSGKPDFVDYVGQPDELLALARRADVIVSCVPLTPETTDLYDAQFFSVLKPTAFFINVARGGSVVTEALTAALNERRLAGAGLDVVDPEPLPPDNPLWNAPRVIITPHISGRSDLPGEARWTVALENLRRYAAGERMLNVVDRERGY